MKTWHGAGQRDRETRDGEKEGSGFLTARSLSLCLSIPPPSQRRRDPRRRTGGVEDHRRTARDHRLDAVDRRHGPAAGFEELVQLGDPKGVFLQWRVQYRRQGLAGEIVFGGADPAGDNEEVAARGKFDDGAFDGRLIVPHGGMGNNSHTPHRRQLPAEPRGVGVDGLAKDQFIPDRENNRVHGCHLSLVTLLCEHLSSATSQR